jgi:hypothetical protein
VDAQICKSISVEQHMIAFHELLKSGMLAKNPRDVELGEMFDHVCKSDDHSLGVFG